MPHRRLGTEGPRTTDDLPGPVLMRRAVFIVTGSDLARLPEAVAEHRAGLEEDEQKRDAEQDGDVRLGLVPAGDAVLGRVGAGALAELVARDLDALRVARLGGGVVVAALRAGLALAIVPGRLADEALHTTPLPHSPQKRASGAIGLPQWPQWALCTASGVPHFALKQFSGQTHWPHDVHFLKFGVASCTAFS